MAKIKYDGHTRTMGPRVSLTAGKYKALNINRAAAGVLGLSAGQAVSLAFEDGLTDNGKPNKKGARFELYLVDEGTAGSVKLRERNTSGSLYVNASAFVEEIGLAVPEAMKLTSSKEGETIVLALPTP